MRIALEGIPLSNGRYGNEDRKAVAKIGDKFEMKVDNATKKMTVYENGKLIRTFPVSLGKKCTPSSSGTMVVMDKKESTVFDTFAELGPDEGYRTNIDFAQRLTWGGEYIHSAPWSVGDQGVRNVSHGCVKSPPGTRVGCSTRPGSATRSRSRAPSANSRTATAGPPGTRPGTTTSRAAPCPYRRIW